MYLVIRLLAVWCAIWIGAHISLANAIYRPQLRAAERVNGERITCNCWLINAGFALAVGDVVISSVSQSLDGIWASSAARRLNAIPFDWQIGQREIAEYLTDVDEKTLLSYCASPIAKSRWNIHCYYGPISTTNVLCRIYHLFVAKIENYFVMESYSSFESDRDVYYSLFILSILNSKRL